MFIVISTFLLLSHLIFNIYLRRKCTIPVFSSDSVRPSVFIEFLYVQQTGVKNSKFKEIKKKWTFSLIFSRVKFPSFSSCTQPSHCSSSMSYLCSPTQPSVSGINGSLNCPYQLLSLVDSFHSLCRLPVCSADSFHSLSRHILEVWLIYFILLFWVILLICSSSFSITCKKPKRTLSFRKMTHGSVPIGIEFSVR